MVCNSYLFISILGTGTVMQSLILYHYLDMAHLRVRCDGMGFSVVEQ